MAIALNTISHAFRPIAPVVSAMGNRLVQKLILLVKSLFNIAQWSFVSLYGAKEILFDRVSDFSKTKRPIILTDAKRVNNYLNRVFFKKDSFLGPIKFNVVHGSLYLASGLAGSVAAMHQQKWLNAGELAFPLEATGNCLFGLASLVALIQNVKIYRAAAKVPAYAPPHAQNAASMLKKSSVLGFISSLNYIIGSALLMIGPAAALALLFGCIAVFVGGLKILYDFIRFREAR